MPITPTQAANFYSWQPSEQIYGQQLIGQGYKFVDRGTAMPDGASVKHIGAGSSGGGLLYYKEAAAPTPAPAPAPAPSGSAATAPSERAPVGDGGSPASRQTAVGAGQSQTAYRESLPATTHTQQSWVPGNDKSNANLATPGLLAAARGTQESTNRAVDNFRWQALNTSEQKRDSDERNIDRLSPDLALANPGDELKQFYAQISKDMQGTLGLA